MNISLSTLKRIWNYVNATTNPTTYTLSTLSRFVGFHNWEDFLANYNADQLSSHRISAPTFLISECTENQAIHIRWSPDRHCVFKRQADNRFVVVATKNSKLEIGDSFRLTDVIVGEPLYLYDFVHKGNAPAIFVIGQNGGISDVQIEQE